MTFRFEERPKSGNSTKESVEKLYLASGSDDETYVRAVALSATPFVVSMPEGLMYRQDISISHEGFNLFYATATYGPRKRENGSWRMSFDTTGGTVHITKSKQHINRYPPTARDYGGLIGVHDNEVDGVDIVIPASKITINFKHPLGVISHERIKQLCYFTGYVNSDTWLSYQPGEVLFLGCKGSEGADSETEVGYDFIISQNVTGLVIDGILDGQGNPAQIAKRGHELSWISYRNVTKNGLDVKEANAVYIERVYNTTNFAQLLGFGG